jgi:L-fuculose-phosphate aldolase
MGERETGELICEIGRRIWIRGWGAANDGNISVRVGKNRVIATPAGVSKGFMRPGMMSAVDLDGRVIEPSADGYPVTSEIKVHLACYKFRPDINSVIHSHPPKATAFAAAGIPLNGHYIPETIYSLGSVPVVGYATPGTQALADMAEPYLADHDAFLMANHGAVTVGEDLLSAYYTMETVEYLAGLMMDIRALGGAPALPEEEARAILEMRARKKAPGRHPGMRTYG